MTFDAWVTDLSLGILLLAVGIGVLARFPREVCVAWRMRICGWKPDTECRNGGAAPRADPSRGEPGPGR